MKHIANKDNFLPPLASEIVDRQIAINLQSKRIHTKTHTGEVIDLSGSLYEVETVDELRALNVQHVSTAFLKDNRKKGVFILDTAQSPDDGIVHISGWKRVFERDAIDLAWSDIKGDGTTDDTKAFQHILDVASSLGLGVYSSIPFTISVDKVRIGSNIPRVILPNCIIKGRGNTDPKIIHSALVEIGDEATSVSNTLFSLHIDMSMGDVTAILGVNIHKCTFKECFISGFTDNPDYDHRGIYLIEGSSHNTIKDCEIVGANKPVRKGILIDIWAKLGTLPNFGGFFDGISLRAPNPATHNIIENNILTDGSYAVNLQGVEYTQFTGNVCENNNHRGIYVANGSFKNHIKDNIIINFGSSGVLMGYAASNNTFSENILYREGMLSNEAAINIITGAKGNIITGNDIDTGSNYGIYVAVDSSFTIIRNNSIKNSYVAHIGLDSDWASTRPLNSIFSRPNYALPNTVNTGSDSWASHPLEGIVIDGNMFGKGYSGRSICCLSIAQINSSSSSSVQKIKNITIKDNIFLSEENVFMAVYLYAETLGALEEISFKGNMFSEDMTVSKIRAASISGEQDIIAVSPTIHSAESGIMDSAIAEKPLYLVGATPSVNGNTSVQYMQCFNPQATDILDFTDGSIGQVIYVFFDGNTTIKYSSDKIRLSGAEDAFGANANNCITLIYKGVWIEVARNF